MLQFMFDLLELTFGKVMIQNKLVVALFQTLLLRFNDMFQKTQQLMFFRLFLMVCTNRGFRDFF